ncbi:MAG: 3-phosphoshikimate 1-carboxyvinyltransferase, partial [Trichococcus flocculiformis]
VWSYKDHRIAMMLAIAATVCEQPITITDAECVSKSYPDFWEDYKAIGGKIQ